MNNDILPFWQEIGTSASIISKRVSEKLGVKTSHTGTLDPLAKGVVLIITGEDSDNKERYIQEQKEYEFEMVLGFSTDTHDGMGIIERIEKQEDLDLINEEDIKRVIQNYKGKLHQRYPDFSSKKIEGKSLWEYKRLGLSVPEAYIDGEIYDIKVVSINKVSSKEIISDIENQILSVMGNFRQKEILQNYKIAKFPESFISVKVRVLMSRGLYVRGLVRDLSLSLNSNGVVYNLVRTKDGKYSYYDCLKLSEYFSEKISKDKNFLSPTFLNL